MNFIEDTLYFIIDEKIYPIKINFQSSEAFSKVAKEKEDVTLVDSSKISVITDYEVENYTVISIQYLLEQEIITKMLDANQVKIRYYAPPEMITLRLSNLKISALKSLIRTEPKAGNKDRLYIN